MSQQSLRGHRLRSGLMGLSGRATRPLDRRIHQFILGLVPAEDGIPIPGVLGFLGCYWRQLLRRPAAMRGEAQIVSLDAPSAARRAGTRRPATAGRWRRRWSA